MTRISPLNPASATGKAKQLLDAVQAKLGMTPNLMKTMATAPAALEGYLSLNGALGSADALLDAKFREQLALAIAQANSCEYCLAAHSAIGKMAGLKPDEIAASRHSHSSDSRKQAGLTFAQSIVVNRGNVSNAEFEEIRQAGYSDGEITEIVAHVALNILTNYFNHVAQTEVDFPRVPVTLAQSA